jgi:hypothetical protein
MRHQLAAKSDEAFDLLRGLKAHAGDAEVSGLNWMDLVDKMFEADDMVVPIAKRSVYKIPTPVGKDIYRFISSFTAETGPLMEMYSKIGDAWMFGVLNLRPQWVANNVYGNLAFAAMQGVHPLNPYAWGPMMDSAKAYLAHKGLVKGEAAQKLAGAFELPDVAGGFMRSAGQTEARAGTEAMLSKVKLGWLGKAGEKVAAVNADVEAFFRVASYFYETKKLMRQRPTIERAARTGALLPETLADRVAELRVNPLAALDDPAHAQAVAQVNRYFNDYQKSNYLTRKVLRGVMPFHKFYGHAIDLGLRYPFEKPAQMAFLRGVAAIGVQEVKDQVKAWGMDYDTNVPPHMKDSIPVGVETGPDGRPVIRMMSSRGPSPFSLLTAADQGPMGGALGVAGGQAMGLGAIHPVIKVAIEKVTGVNLFTLQPVSAPGVTFAGKAMDPRTGQLQAAHPTVPFLELVARQVPAYQALEKAVVGTRVPYDVTTLPQMLRNAPEAYKRDSTGALIRRPKGGLVERATGGIIGQAPQFVAPPTPAQRKADSAAYSELLKQALRLHPEKRAEIERLLAEGADAWGAPSWGE